MIDRHQLRTLSLAALAVSIVSGGVAFLATKSAAIGLGVPAGAIMGLVPFVTWAWFLSRLLEKKSVLLFALISFAKLGFYAGALYFLVYQGRVHPMALGAGVGLSALALGIGVLLQERGTHTGSRA
ncbi:MAG TPA: hypothetical protein VFC90_01485 [Planctomycetota bacterium]|nr:hypothetical protein [Planctomycetota bacterium]